MEVNKYIKAKIDTKERKPLLSFIVPNGDLGANIPDISGYTRRFLEGGYANGYVAIPPGHPCYKMSYDDINVGVHGGLTFANLADEVIAAGWNPEIVTDDYKGYWIVGFDTRHSEDNRERWPKEAVEAETESLKKQLESMW